MVKNEDYTLTIIYYLEYILFAGFILWSHLDGRSLKIHCELWFGLITPKLRFGKKEKPLLYLCTYMYPRRIKTNFVLLTINKTGGYLKFLSVLCIMTLPTWDAPQGLASFHWVRQGCSSSVIRLTRFRWLCFQCVCPRISLETSTILPGFLLPGTVVALHRCSSKAQALLMTLDEVCIVTDKSPDLELL